MQGLSDYGLNFVNTAKGMGCQRRISPRRSRQASNAIFTVGHHFRTRRRKRNRLPGVEDPGQIGEVMTLLRFHPWTRLSRNYLVPRASGQPLFDPRHPSQ